MRRGPTPPRKPPLYGPSASLRLLGAIDERARIDGSHNTGSPGVACKARRRKVRAKFSLGVSVFVADDAGVLGVFRPCATSDDRPERRLTRFSFPLAPRPPPSPRAPLARSGLRRSTYIHRTVA